MSVTERLMKPGRFALRLRPNTPASIPAAIGMYDHIVITPARLRGWEGMSDANILASAIYTGVIKAMPDVNEITGAGLGDWLGTDDGLGDLLDTAATGTAASLSTWVSTLRPASLAAGTVNNSGTTTHTYSYQWMTRREALTHACRSMGAEWRIDPDFTLDAAAPGNLHANYTTPRAVITRHAEGDQGSLVGIETVRSVRGLDVANYTTKVIVVAREGDGAALATGSATGANVYKDGLNNNVVMERLIDAPSEPAANANNYAQSTLNLFGSARQTLALSSSTYAATLAAKPGDRVWVYDPRAGLVDSANQIAWRGEIITPVLLRCRGITWPIMAGMGVYARRSGATPTYTDLSDWFLPEDDTTEWEVSTTGLDVDDPAQLGAAYLGSNPDVVSRTVAPPVAPWTPTVSGLTVGNGSWDAEYSIVGDRCKIRGLFLLGSTSAITGRLVVTCPVTAAKNIQPGQIGCGFWNGNQVVAYCSSVGSATQFAIDAVSASSAYAQAAATSSTVPFTWATNNTFEFEGEYRIA